MVKLNRITTKGGDSGQTSLGDGRRVPKHEARVAAYGDVDELNAVLGLALMELERDSALDTARNLALRGQLGRLQNDLFDLGADLCVPGAAGERLRIPAAHVERLEDWIAAWNADLPALESFVLPAGSPATCQLHHARTVCRRAERAFYQLAGGTLADGDLNPLVGVYLNRLSDLLFVMARAAAPAGERLWHPGG
ncbi:MAG: cob(I)yrinic acid a,c-diamide adenosyltransferase [Candidatus Delongbacteria bacterium]